MHGDMKSIGKRIAYAREIRGMTQQQLADAIGNSQSAIGNWEKDAREKPRNLLLLAEALGVSAKWIEFGDGPMVPENPRLRPDVCDLAVLIDARLTALRIALGLHKSLSYWRLACATRFPALSRTMTARRWRKISGSPFSYLKSH